METFKDAFDNLIRDLAAKEAAMVARGKLPEMTGVDVAGNSGPIGPNMGGGKQNAL